MNSKEILSNIGRILPAKLQNKKPNGETPAATPPRPGTQFMSWAEIDRASEAFSRPNKPGVAKWSEFQNKALPLPDWYDHQLDPLSAEYRAQQDRLWQLMIGESAEYDPARDEDNDCSRLEALRAPGFYAGLFDQAGDHLIAMGHMVKLSGLKRGDRVLEYGAGFGQIALAMARLGAKVDTVDINETTCAAIRKQAKWFNVELRSYRGEFGDNPAGEKYDVVMFYEAFHHARDFVKLIEAIKDILTDNGKIMMGGEPIAVAGDAATMIPYPWGIRLGADTAAVVRNRRWYELGFREEFILKLFMNMGFLFKKHPGVISHYATVYEFKLRQPAVKLSGMNFPSDLEAGWHIREANGRWTKGSAVLPIDRTGNWSTLAIGCHNFHRMNQVATFTFGGEVKVVKFGRGDLIEVTFNRPSGPVGDLTIESNPIQPHQYGVKDDRELGIFVTELKYNA